MPVTELLETVVNKAIDLRLSDVRVALPGRIVSYDAASQLADVKPQIHRRFPDGHTEELPILVDVPILWPRSGGASITLPVLAGDPVLLLFSDRSIEDWLSKGEEGPPEDPRKHHLTDALGIMGVMPVSETGDGNGTDLLVKYGDSTITIRADGNVELDAAGNELHATAAGNSVDLTSSSAKMARGSARVELTDAAAELSIGAGKFKALPGGQIALGGAGELVAVLLQLCVALMAVTTVNAGPNPGDPEPLTPDSITSIQAIQAQLLALQGTL